MREEPPDERARVPMISFRNGVKYVDGVEMHITGSRQFRSSNGTTIYTSLMWSDGKASCNCPGWSSCPLRNKKTGQLQDKTCSHARQVRAGDNILIDQGTGIGVNPFLSGRVEDEKKGRKIIL